MKPRRSRAATVGAALVGILLGSVAAFAADSVRAPERQTPPEAVPPPPVVEIADVAPAQRAIVVVASPHGLPRDLGRRLARLPEVHAVTSVVAHLEWLTETRSPSGAVIDRPSRGRAIPFELAGVDRIRFARFVDPSERAGILSLKPGRILLAETESELRKGGVGMRLRFGSSMREVTGVLSDASTGGYEGIVDKGDLGPGSRLDRYLLVMIDSVESRQIIDRRLQRWLDDRPFRSRLSGEAPFMRYGDSVLPQMIIKKTFGEFSATPGRDGSLDIDPAWVRRNIASGRVPLLGEVACHRVALPQMREALRAVTAAGLSFAVDPAQYAGCFGPRFVNADPSGRLSHHAWGIAFDLNVSTNPFGGRVDQDRRLVRILESRGFTWGGRWLIPDGMHFEWVRFP